MRTEIPLEVLGLLGPILSWVENTQAQALPKSWLGEAATERFDRENFREEDEIAASFQERSWLLQELPTYSLDNIDDVIAYSRASTATKPSKRRWQPVARRLALPSRYDLLWVFDKLAERYLVWNGGKVAIQAGRMVELHELGLRIPLAFLVRHTHARAVTAGERALRDVAELPEAISLLPSNSHGMRAVIRRGLSEGHLHLNSIHATEIGWADHLLKPLNRKPRDFEEAEWRLLRLGRASARIVALATAFCRGKMEPEADNAKKLLGQLDAMYFSKSAEAMRFHEEGFKKYFDKIVEKLDPATLMAADHWPRKRRPDREPEPLYGNRRKDSGRLGLLYWLDPWRQTHHWSNRGAQFAYRKTATPHEREEYVASLHLAAHLALIQARHGTGDRADANQTNIIYHSRAGRFLHRALYRYLICQTHHWQLAVQQGRTTGLRRFKLFYDSNQRYPIEPTSQEKADSVLRRAREWRGLRVLEGRVGPPRTSVDLMHWIKAFAAGARDERVEKMGLVVHFIKRPEARKSHPPGLNRARYADLRDEYRKQAFQLFRILEQPSLATPFIVGIDAANLELATPPEVFAPVFRFLRERPIALRATNRADFEMLGDGRIPRVLRDLVERRRLGMTYHVGEDFRHLLSGLRAIDEVLEFLKPQPGDRIGHGIALGLDPAVWLNQTGHHALVPKMEWLDTLVWLHNLLGAGDDLLGQLQIETKIEQLGRDLYLNIGARGHRRIDSHCKEQISRRARYLSGDLDPGRAVTPLVLRDVWKLRQLDPAFIDWRDSEPLMRFNPVAGDDSATWRWNSIMHSVFQETLKQVGRNPPIDFLVRYWYSDATRKAGNELCRVDMDPQKDLWIEVCRKAQKLMQKRVAKKQVAVEVNPSANRVIGPMSRLSEHHIFNLTLNEEKQLDKRLRVTVNTDNPGTANTSLTHEYYLLGETYMDMGKSEVEVADWLDWLRKSGDESSFVRQLPKPTSKHMETVMNRLREIRRPLRELRDPDVCLAELWRSLWSDR